MGVGRAEVWDADHVVFDWRGFLHCIHGHRRSGGDVRSRRIRILRDSLLHPAVSVHDAGATEVVGDLSPQWVRDAGRLRAWSLWQPRALDCDCAYGNPGDDAIYRAATCGDARSDRSAGRSWGMA